MSAPHAPILNNDVECARKGCAYIAEMVVERADTGETRKVCRSCGRWLVETTPRLQTRAVIEKVDL